MFTLFSMLWTSVKSQKLTEFIRDVLGSFSDRIHILLTSRNEDCLRTLQIDLVSFDLGLENGDVQADLRNFV